MEGRHLNTQRPGMPETLYRPGLNEDLSPKLADDDGDVIGPVSAKTLVVEQLWEPPRGSMCWMPFITLSRVEISSYLTESRLVYVCANYGKLRARVQVGPLAREPISGRAAAKSTEGAPLVGQVRFPWIQAWERRDNILRFLAETRDTYPAPTPAYSPLLISLALRTNQDAQALGDVLTRRIVTYRLVDSCPKDEAVMHDLGDLLAGRIEGVRPAERFEVSHDIGYPRLGMPGHLPWGEGMEYAPPAPASQLLG